MINKLFIITIQIILIYGGNASRGTPHIAQIPLGSSRHVTSRHNLTRSTCWAHVFLAVSSLSNSTARHARHDELDTSNVLSPCILDVSSLSNSTARHVRIVSMRSTRRTCRVEKWRDEPSEIWAYGMVAASCILSQSINQNYFIVRLKVDQRAGQLSLPHLGITKTEKIELKHKGRWANKFGEQSRAMWSIRQTETD